MTRAAFTADDYMGDDDVACPRCSGWGHVNCHCGGDLCVCDNYGEADCPLCFGDGQISQARYDQYQAEQQQHLAAMRRAFAGHYPEKEGE